jgi:hypothetical protein
MANISRIKERRKKYYEKQKLIRQERRKLKLCIHCGAKVKPVKVYPQECDKHAYHRKEWNGKELI